MASELLEKKMLDMNCFLGLMRKKREKKLMSETKTDYEMHRKREKSKEHYHELIAKENLYTSEKRTDLEIMRRRAKL